jgi:hypothetical protein
VKEPDCLDAVLLAKQVDRRHDSRLDKSPSVWTLARDVVATVDSTKVASSVFVLRHWAGHIGRGMACHLHRKNRTYEIMPRTGFETVMPVVV